MSPIAVALEREEWESVALRLLLGVRAAAAKLPQGALEGLLAVLEGGRESGGR